MSVGYGGMYIYDPITYTSPNTLNLLASGDIYVAADIQNSGTGDINVVAGWDGTTTDPSLFANIRASMAIIAARSM